MLLPLTAVHSGVLLSASWHVCRISVMHNDAASPGVRASVIRLAAASAAAKHHGDVWQLNTQATHNNSCHDWRTACAEIALDSKYSYQGKILHQQTNYTV